MTADRPNRNPEATRNGPGNVLRGDRDEEQGRKAEEHREDDGPAEADQPREAARDQRADDRSDVAEAEDEPDLPRREAEVLHDVDDVGRHGDRAEQVRRPGRRGDAAQVPVAQHVAEAGRDLVAQAQARLTVLVHMSIGRRLLAADEEDEDARREEADRIEDDRRSGPSRRWMRPPPIAGPAVWAMVREISSLPLPSTSWSRSTSDGRYDMYATSKKTVSVPLMNPTRYSCQIVRPSNAYAIGIEARLSRAPEVADDQDRASPKSIDPGAGRQAEQDEREELDGPEQGRPRTGSRPAGRRRRAGWRAG